MRKPYRLRRERNGLRVTSSVSRTSFPRRSHLELPTSSALGPVHSSVPGNPFNAPAVVSEYEAWYTGPGRRADRLEKALLLRLLGSFPGARTALEIGCGTGHFTRFLEQQGLQMVGLDASDRMLAEAHRLGTLRCVQGDALGLPCASRAFDLVFLIATLEFLPDAARGLAEAVRVARHGVLLGALNRWSHVGLRIRLRRDGVWRSAHLSSPRGLARLAWQSAGNRLQALQCRTTLWPLPGVEDLALPWGGFIGMAVHLREDIRGA